jgi:hypothetical protein
VHIACTRRPYVPLFRRTPKQTSAAPFVGDETLGIPEVAAAQARAAEGDLDGIAEIHQSAATIGNAHAIVRLAADTAPLEQVARWRAGRPGDPLAATVHGLALITEGWSIRGGGQADTVGRSAFERFWENLQAAEREFEHATGSWSGAPSAWTGLVLANRGLQKSQEELIHLYRQGVTSGGADLLELQEQTLQGLCRKWGGTTDEAMFTFARSLADASKPLPANALVCIGHLEAWVAEMDDGQLDSTYLTRPTVAAEVQEMAASAWRPGFPSDFSGLGAHNVFAVLLAGVGDLDGAAKHVHYLGPRVREWPWSYLVRRGALLADLRERAS